MSEIISFPLPAGPNFTIPDVGDLNWGQSVTNYLVAIPHGVPPTAGTFTLTGDLSFGPSFGLISKYLISQASNPASAGFLRLAHGDTITWRNNANSGNLTLSANSSDNLVWTNGLILQNANALGLQDSGSTHTISLQSPSVATNYSITLPPNAGISGQVLQTDGTGVTTWVNATGTGTVNAGTIHQLTYYATTGSAVSPTGANLVYDATVHQLTVGGIGSTGTLKLGTTGTLYFISNGTNDTAIQATAPLGPRLYTIPDSGANSSFIMSDGAQTFTGVNTFSGGAGAITMSGSTINMGSNKITNLANGTNPQDAATINQISSVAGFQSGDMKAAAYTTIPSGWLLCDGTSYATATYPTLFTAIGYSFGGSGANFNVPNMVNKVAAGAGSLVAFGASTGSQTHAITGAEMPVHNHGINDPGHHHDRSKNTPTINVDNTGSTRVDVYGSPTANDGSSQTSNDVTGISTQASGSGTAMSLVQPTLGVTWFIKI